MSCKSKPIELRDSRGVVRLSLSLEDENDNPRLTFYDKSGIECCILGIRDDNCAWLNFHDEESHHEIGIGLTRDHGPMLMMHNKGVFPAIIANAHESNASLILIDSDGKEHMISTSNCHH
jgi:hypothetical protein